MQTSYQEKDKNEPSCWGWIIAKFIKPLLLVGTLVILFVIYYLATINSRIAIASNNSVAITDLRNIKTYLDEYKSVKGQFPSSLSELHYKPNNEVLVSCFLEPQQYVCTIAHKSGTKQYLSNSHNPSIYMQKYRARDGMVAPRREDLTKTENAWEKYADK